MYQLLVGLSALFLAGLAHASPGELARFEDVVLNPSGSKVLMIEAAAETYDLVTLDLDSGERHVALKGDAGGAMLNWCRWANDTRIVCSLRAYRAIGRVGQVTFTWLVAVDQDGANPLRLVPRAKNQVRRAPVWNPQVQDRVIAWMPDDPEHVLVALNRDHPNRPSVYSLNIYNNRIGRVMKPRERVHRWYATYDGHIRLGVGYRQDDQPVVYRVDGHRLTPFEFDLFESEIPPSPLGFSADEQFAYMNMTNHEDRHGIYRVRLSDGTVDRAVYRDPNYDVFGRLVFHPRTGTPVGVEYVRDHPQRVWFDSDVETTFRNMDERLPGDHFKVWSTDDGDGRLVVLAYGGIVPRVMLYDVAEGTSRLLGVQYESFTDDEIADLVPVVYPSRDGLDIPAYLAVPNDRGDRTLPAVVIPHGGPYARDTAEFDYWVQFLVSRGYVVLKPNYRGSVGYGEWFMQAGYREWGLKMQEDLVDGIQWLVQAGYAEPGRVCVVGASYGGFSALVSAFKSADRIRCAVSLAGISDLEKMVERIYFFDLVHRNRSRIQFGEALRRNSPLHQVDRIEVPVLLVHGDRDTVVRVRQSRAMAEALSRHDKTFEYIEQTDGDHFLSGRSQRTEFFEAVGRFLAQHLGSQ